MQESNVKLVAITKGVGELENKTAEEVISFAARVSNPSNQNNFETAPKLLGYCARQEHWSVFETASFTVEIKTTIAISMQILRHRSFTFQQFSGRYSKVQNYLPVNPRRQDLKNRQNSTDDLQDEDKNWFLKAQRENWNESYSLYEEALRRNIAKESARMLLPLNSESTLFMTGNIRNWIFYIETRTKDGVQEEHKQIALEVKKIFMKEFPSISLALNWK